MGQNLECVLAFKQDYFYHFTSKNMTLFFIQSTTVNSHNFNFPGLEELHFSLTFIMNPFLTFMHLINFTLLDFSKITGVGSHSFLQGIFPTQGLNPGLLLCRQILYHLRHQGNPIVLNKNRPKVNMKHLRKLFTMKYCNKSNH